MLSGFCWIASRNPSLAAQEKGVHPIGNVETGRIQRLWDVGGRRAGGRPGKDGGELERAFGPARLRGRGGSVGSGSAAVGALEKKRVHLVRVHF